MSQKWFLAALMIAVGLSTTGCTTFNGKYWGSAVAHGKYPVDDRAVITPLE